MNILISINKNYLKSAEVMMGSLSRRVNEQIDVYLLNKSLSQDEICKFELRLRKLQNVTLNVIEVPNSFIDDLPIINHFSKEMYYRIVAHFFLPQDLNRILWLDSDLIVLNDISSFYYQDFDGAYMVACPDIVNENDLLNGTNDGDKYKERLGLAKEHIYFNSGVLLMNLELIRKSVDIDVIQNCANAIKMNLTYPDQDILNVLYQNKIKYADFKRYNYQANHLKRIPKEEVENIAVLHYVGSKKPWSSQFVGTHAKFWRKEANQTGGFLFENLKWIVLSPIFKFVYNVFRMIKK